MIYKLILKPKYRKALRTLCLIMITAFSLMIYSCNTFYTEDYTSERFIVEGDKEDLKVLELKTKDTTLNVSNFNVTYKEKEMSSSFLLEKIDSILIKESGTRAIRVRRTLSELNLTDVYNIKVEKSKYDPGTSWMLIGITVGALVTAGLILFAISKNKTETAWEKFWRNYGGH